MPEVEAWISQAAGWSRWPSVSTDVRSCRAIPATQTGTRSPRQWTLSHGSGTLILGNGDIRSLDDAYQRIADYGVDGVLIGRASYGNPFVFQPDGEKILEADKYRLLHIALEHAQVYEQSFSHLERYQFVPMRKHLGWYAHDIPAATGCATIWPAVRAWTRQRPFWSAISTTGRAGKGENKTSSYSKKFTEIRLISVIRGELLPEVDCQCQCRKILIPRRVTNLHKG